MKNKNNKKHSFSIKYFLFMMVVLLFFIFIVCSLFKKNEDYTESYLVSTNTIKYEIDDINHVNDLFNETPNEYFIYISYPNNIKINKLEKKLKIVIDDYNISDCFYYINIQNLLEDNYKEKLSNIFRFNIKNIPSILYVKDGKITDIIYNDSGVFNINSFTNLLDMLEYQKESH